MALDGISAAAGILGIAQIGIQLASSISQFVSTVKATDKELKAIQPDISAIGFVIKQTRDHFHGHAKHYTTDLVTELQATLQDTNGTLQKVKKLLDKLFGGAGIGRPLLADRLDYAFSKKEKMKVLLADLGRRKATLTLMLGVAALGRRMASNGDNDMIGIQKLTVDALIKAKDEATQKYEDLVRSFTFLQTKIDSAAETFTIQNLLASPDLRQEQFNPFVAQQRRIDDPSELNNVAINSMREMSPMDTQGPVSKGARGGDVNGIDKDNDPDSQAQSEDGVTLCLLECATAIDSLGDRIYSATKWWRREKTMDEHPIVSSYEATAEAIMNLRSRIKLREGVGTYQTVELPAPSPQQQNIDHGVHDAKDVKQPTEVHKYPEARSQSTFVRLPSQADDLIVSGDYKHAHISCFCGNEDDDGVMIACNDCGDLIHRACFLPILEQKKRIACSDHTITAPTPGPYQGLFGGHQPELSKKQAACTKLERSERSARTSVRSSRPVASHSADSKISVIHRVDSARAPETRDRKVVPRLLPMQYNYSSSQHPGHVYPLLPHSCEADKTRLGPCNDPDCRDPDCQQRLSRERRYTSSYQQDTKVPLHTLPYASSYSARQGSPAIPGLTAPKTVPQSMSRMSSARTSTVLLEPETGTESLSSESETSETENEYHRRKPHERRRSHAQATMTSTVPSRRLSEVDGEKSVRTTPLSRREQRSTSRAQEDMVAAVPSSRPIVKGTMKNRTQSAAPTRSRRESLRLDNTPRSAKYLDDSSSSVRNDPDRRASSAVSGWRSITPSARGSHIPSISTTASDGGTRVGRGAYSKVIIEDKDGHRRTAHLSKSQQSDLIRRMEQARLNDRRDEQRMTEEQIAAYQRNINSGESYNLKLQTVKNATRKSGSHSDSHVSSRSQKGSRSDSRLSKPDEIVIQTDGTILHIHNGQDDHAQSGTEESETSQILVEDSAAGRTNSYHSSKSSGRRAHKPSEKRETIYEQDEYEEDLAESSNTSIQHVEDDAGLADEHEEDLALSPRPVTVTQDLGDHRLSEDVKFDTPFGRVDQLLRKWIKPAV